MNTNDTLELGGFAAVLGNLSNGQTEFGEKKDYPIMDPKLLTGEVDEEDEFDEEAEAARLEEEALKLAADARKAAGTEEEDEEDEDVDEDGGEGAGANSDGFGDMEAEMAEYVTEKLFEGFGWEKGETKVESMEELSELVKSIIEENSTPVYANDELAKLDEYVRNGGDIKTYLSTTSGGINFDTLNLDKENDQKTLVKENLKLKGYSDTRIQKALERYEDAGTLREEAEDAEEILKEYNEGLSKKLLEDQKNQKAAQLESQQKYFESVETQIKDIKDIRGVEISASEKKQLLEYIFKPVSNGRTQFQNDYVKDQRNLIESAYFTMKGDKLIQKVTTKANTTAAQKLRDKLANKGKRGKDQSGSGSSYASFIDAASTQLRKPF